MMTKAFCKCGQKYITFIAVGDHHHDDIYGNDDDDDEVLPGHHWPRAQQAQQLQAQRILRWKLKLGTHSP